MHACCQYLSSLDGPVIVDVGAHHGAYAIVLGAMAQESGGRVIALEPNPESVAVLTRNVALNGLVDVVAIEPMAVTREPCTVKLNLDGAESRISQEGVKVPGEPLSSILGRHHVSAVDLMIIDVEGAELDVLRSVPWDSVPVGRIFCEMNPCNWPPDGHIHEGLARFLEERHLRCQDMYLTEHQAFKGDGYIGPCLLSVTH